MPSLAREKGRVTTTAPSNQGKRGAGRIHRIADRAKKKKRRREESYSRNPLPAKEGGQFGFAIGIVEMKGRREDGEPSETFQSEGKKGGETSLPLRVFRGHNRTGEIKEEGIRKGVILEIRQGAERSKKKLREIFARIRRRRGGKEGGGASVVHETFCFAGGVPKPMPEKRQKKKKEVECQRSLIILR